MKNRGVEHALYTDVSRDGSMLGVNIHDTVALARNYRPQSNCFRRC